MRKIIATLYNATTKGKHHIGAVRFLIRLCANILIYPLSWCRPPQQQEEEPQVILSMTSFPQRIGQVWKTLIPLLHQRTKISYKIILWLSKEQFQEWEAIPEKLRSLTKWHFEICLKEDDLKSHKKYYYAFSEYKDRVIITVDDDVMYSLDLLQTLYDAHKRNPQAVCCCRGRQVTFNTYGNTNTYTQWRILSTSEQDTESNLILPTGIGGVLYPPFSYSMEIFNIEAIKQTCINGDDLWLNLMCRIHGSKILHVANKYRYSTLFFSQKSSLSKSNVKKNENDRQIKLISKWATQQLGYDFFYRMTP